LFSLLTTKKRGLIAAVPEIEWLRVPRPDFDFLGFEEAGRLLAAVDPGWRCMVITAMKTGLRQGELIALQWQDIDLVAGLLRVRRSAVRGVIGVAKSGKGREVPLGDEVLAALKTERHLRGPLVLCTPEGRMFTKHECKHPLWRACKRSGLREIGWHVLRHTFASHLVMRGATMEAVQGAARSRHDRDDESVLASQPGSAAPRGQAARWARLDLREADWATAGRQRNPSLST
jgi:integrase